MLCFKIPLEMSLENQLTQDLTAHSHEADDSRPSGSITAHVPSAAVHVEHMTHAPVDTGADITSRYRPRAAFL